MVADGLTKLAAADVMTNLRAATGGDFPPAVLPTATFVKSTVENLGAEATGR